MTIELKTTFIMSKKDGHITIDNDRLSDLIIDTLGEDILNEYDEVVFEQDKLKEYIDGCIGEPTTDIQITHVVHYLKTESGMVDYTILMESDKIMDFIAKITNKPRFMLDQIFKDEIDTKSTPKTEYTYLLNKKRYDYGVRKMVYKLDKYDIPLDILKSDPIETYNGLIITTKEKIPGLFELEPGCKLYWDQITALMYDIRKETTEDSSTLYFSIPDFNTKELHETSIPTASIGKSGIWATMILTISHGVLTPVHKDDKWAFEEHMTKMVNNTSKIKSVVDTTPVKNSEVESAMLGWAEASLELGLKWTDIEDVMLNDESKTTVYIPSYNIINDEYIVDDEEEVDVPAHVIITFARNCKLGYRYAKDGLGFDTKQRGGGCRPSVGPIKYKVIKSWHKMYISQSKTDAFGNLKEDASKYLKALQDPNGKPNKPTTKAAPISKHTEQGRLIGGKSSEPRIATQKVDDKEDE